MTYGFVAARYFTVGGLKQARAVVLHMAEGTGTVSWLTHPTNDNSSHFVVDRLGKVTQMVRWADADHSLHVDRPYGPPGPGDCGIFSLDEAKALLGADGIADPNAYLVAVEIEGWALTHRDTRTGEIYPPGPNAAQVAALQMLIDDIVAHYGTVRGLLGHRDFQNYKPCPGCGVFDKFHHGAFVTAGPVQSAPSQEVPLGPFPIDPADKIVDVIVGRQLYQLDLQPRVTASNVVGADSPAGYRTGGVNYRVIEVPIGGIPEFVLVKNTDCSRIADPPVPAADCTAEKEAYAAAVKAAIAGVPI